METDTSKAKVILYKFSILFPAILLLFLTLMIYVSYWVNYLILLLHDYSSPEMELKQLFKYPFLISSNPKNSFLKGICLAVFLSLFLILFLISILRTILSDPGEFPPPNELEFKIALKNLFIEELYKTRINSKTNIFDKLLTNVPKKPTKDLRSSNSNSNKNRNQENNNDLDNNNSPTNKNCISQDIIEEECKNDRVDLSNFTQTMKNFPICQVEKNRVNKYLDNWNYFNSKNPPESIDDYGLINTFQRKENNMYNVSGRTYKNQSSAPNDTEFLNIIEPIYRENNKSSKKPQFIHSEYEINQSFEKAINNISNSAHTNTNDEFDSNVHFNNKKKPFSDEILEILSDEKFDSFIDYDFMKAYICTICLRIKVPRSHHCRQCGKCILKMDHHCFWLANCIGYSNYKFFLLTQLHGIICCIFILSSYWETILSDCLDFSTGIFKLSFDLFVYLCTLTLLIFLIWISSINWPLMFEGMTLIENAERKRFPNTKITNIYDLGYYENFTIIFGRNPLIWFLPIANYDKYKGMNYEKNKKSPNSDDHCSSSDDYCSSSDDQEKVSF